MKSLTAEVLVFDLDFDSYVTILGYSNYAELSKHSNLHRAKVKSSPLLVGIEV